MITLRGDQVRPGVYGDGNEIVGQPVEDRCVVYFFGANCRLEFGPRSRIEGAVSFRRDGGLVALGQGSVFRGEMSLGLRCEVRIGSHLYCGREAYFTTAENAAITIGDDCLFSDRVQLRADDSHPFYDGVSGQRLNHARSISIGEHVWVGADVAVLGGAHVGEGSIVGLRTTVTGGKSIPSNSLAVGTPARIVRRNVVWVRKHLQTSTDVAPAIEPVCAVATDIKQARSPVGQWIRSLLGRR